MTGLAVAVQPNAAARQPGGDPLSALGGGQGLIGRSFVRQMVDSERRLDTVNSLLAVGEHRDRRR
jgi:hypothetical protein